MSFEKIKFNSLPSFQQPLQLNTSFAIDNPIFGNNFQFSPTQIDFENYFQNNTSFGLNSPFGLMNFTLPQMDYSQLLENAMKMQNEYMQMIQNQQKTLIENAKKTKLDSKTESYTPEDPKNISYDAKELKEKWSKIKPDLTNGFYEKVVKIAKKINCSPDALMAVMNAESGISATIKNPDPESTATGLIQFTEDTAKDLGTTTAKLKQMSAEKQLDYVEKYLTKNKKAAGISNSQFVDAGTLYALVFLPGRANQKYVTNSTEKYYSAGKNEDLDLNKDGYIAKTELAQRVQSFMA